MFCPKCKCEYVEGIKVCMDCNVKLVVELEDEPEPEEEIVEPTQPVGIDVDKGLTYIEMYRVPGHAEIVKDFLFEKGIEAVLLEDRINQVTRMYVKTKYAQKAEELLDEFDDIASESNRDEYSYEEKTDTRKIAKKKGRFREILYRVIWLITGFIFLEDGVDAILLERYIHGILIFAIGLFILVFVLNRWVEDKKRKT